MENPFNWSPGEVVDVEYIDMPKTWRRVNKEPKSFYLIGSLRNPLIPAFANQIAEAGYEVFADWFSPGPDADDYHRDYAKARGWSYKQFLEGPAAKNIFEFDKFHMDRCDAAVMLMPAGKSGHTELGYTIGRGKPGYLVFEEEPERYEIMVQFATQIFFSRQEFLTFLKEKK